MKTLVANREILAQTKQTWSVISDVGGYSKYAPNIEYSKVLSGTGRGMTRECGNKDGRWTEICQMWNPGQNYAFEVQTGAIDYPYPFKYLQGQWAVKPLDSDKCRIEMTFNYEFNNRILAIFIEPLMRRKFKKVCEELLDNWEKQILVG